MPKKQMLAYGKTNTDFIKWHERYGHLNIQSLINLKNKELVYGLNFKSNAKSLDCIACMKSKCTVKPFEKSTSRATELLEIVHTDVGVVNKPSIGGSKYFVSMIDDKSRYAQVYFIKSKSEVFNVFKNYVSMTERQTNNKIKILRSDNGTEYINKQFNEYLKAKGIKHQLTVPYTPQQNGVAERYNRTLVEMARTMLVSADLNESFWAEAVACAAYIRNRSPTAAVSDATPYEIWTGHKPVVKHFRIFGSTAIALNKSHNNKFCPKGSEYIMVGYSETSKAYRLYDKTKGNVIVSRDVYFIEKEHQEWVDFQDEMVKKDGSSADKGSVQQSIQGARNNQIQSVEVNDDDYATSDELEDSDDENFRVAGEDIIEVQDCNIGAHAEKRGPGRPRILRTGARGRPRKKYNVLNLIHEKIVDVPATVKQALEGEQAKEWYDAMQAEYEALLKNETWELAELPSGKKPIGCKWVFALKKNATGKIERFKARLVAKGCSQKYGIDYDETFSPVARYSTIRMLLAVAAEHQLHVHQLDVTTAYLNGDLQEEVYMRPPEMFDEKNGLVLKLKKSLYGLKQAGRVWNIKLDAALKQMGYKACESEPCLYTMTKNNKINLVVVYVDDLLLACTSLDELIVMKKKIGNHFKVVDKGPAEHFLGMEIERESETGSILIGQEQHIKRVLKDFDMMDCRSVQIPLEPNYQINCSANCKRADKTLYQSLIGSLMYIAIVSRPDILHSVCKLSQKNQDPHSEHFAAAKHVLRYLRNTVDLKIKYTKTGEKVRGFTDADWAGDALDRKSFTGFTFLLAGAAFSWECKKQRSVALSSTEAEYMALSAGAKEAIFLKKLFAEMNMFPKTDSIDLYVDNLSAINLAKNSVYHARSKHIDVRYHHVRDCYENKVIILKYCPTNEMIADVLTKNLARINHEKCTTLLGLKRHTNLGNHLIV